MSANSQYSLYNLSPAIRDSFKRFQEDNRDTFAALAKTLAESVTTPNHLTRNYSGTGAGAHRVPVPVGA